MATQPPIIVIVDDDADSLDVLGRLLDSFARPAEIVAVETGVASLAVARARPVVLVITDYRMPGMDGAQLTRAIKSVSPTTRVAIVSVYNLQDVEQQTDATAVDYILPKPFVLSQLLTMLDACLPGAGTSPTAD